MALFSQTAAATPSSEPTPLPTPVEGLGSPGYTAPAPTATPAPAPVAPGEVNTMAYTLAALVVGGGIIGAVLYFTVVPLAELLNIFLMIILPIAALGMAVGLISAAGFNQFKNGTMITQFLERLKSHRETLAANPAAARK